MGILGDGDHCSDDDSDEDDAGEGKNKQGKKKRSKRSRNKKKKRNKKNKAEKRGQNEVGAGPQGVLDAIAELRSEQVTGEASAENARSSSKTVNAQQEPRVFGIKKDEGGVAHILPRIPT